MGLDLSYCLFSQFPKCPWNYVSGTLYSYYFGQMQQLNQGQRRLHYVRQILTYQKAEVNHFPTASACQFHYSRLQSKRKILRRRNASDKQIHANTKFSLLSFHQLHESPQKKLNTVFIQYILSTNSLLYAILYYMLHNIYYIICYNIYIYIICYIPRPVWDLANDTARNNTNSQFSWEKQKIKRVKI